MLKHIFFSFFIRSHNYLLFVLDLLDHHPSIDQSLISSSQEKIGGFMCKFTYHVTELFPLQSNMYLKY